MKFIKVNKLDFLNNQDFFKEQIPKAQNTKKEYIDDVFEYYNENLKDERNYLVAYMLDNEIISCALVRYYEEEKKYFLINVNTRKDFQHKGVATKFLTTALEDFFSNNKNENIYLWVHPKNEIAIKLYNKLGFQKTDYFPNKLTFKENIINDAIYYCNYELFNNKQNELKNYLSK